MMTAIGSCVSCSRIVVLVLCLPAAAFAEVVWSEDFEGETRWQVRAADGGRVTVTARPEGPGRCLHLKGPESGRHLVILPEVPLQAGRSYLLRWESRAEEVWDAAAVRYGTNKGPLRADGTGVSGTDP